MKNRFWIYTSVLAVVLFAVLLWRRPVKQPVTLEPSQGVVQRASVPARLASAANQSIVGVASTVAPLPLVRKPLTASDDRSPEAVRQYVESQNVPIEFYGMITDQNTNPVTGAKIHAGVRHWINVNPVPFGAEGRTVSVEKETDSNGRFEINGVTGDGLGIGTIAKDGYILSPKTPNSYGPVSGSFENPVIIKMWKEGAKESLVNGSHVFGIDSAKTNTLNLLTGRKIEGEAEGDLLVSITRPPDARPRKNYPWSFSIKVLGGGFVETDPADEFMYLAPESGYEPKIGMQFDPNNPAWTGVIKKQFFIRSRNGQVYGRVQVEVDAIYNVHSAIQINYSVNPAGSRNLQP